MTLKPSLTARMIVALLALCTFRPLAAQEEPAAGLLNGDFESADESGAPEGWRFVRRPDQGQSASLVTDRVDGDYSALLRAPEKNEFTNLMQGLPATQFLGKRVRFRASVKTAALTSSTAVQLWFRVDKERDTVAFDNMQDRPIVSEDFHPFDIVLDVPDDATRLNLGLFLIGTGNAWIDNATLEVVGEDIPTTASVSSQILADATEAPRQSFWTPWLFLVLLACGIFAFSLSAPTGFLTERTSFSGNGGKRLATSVIGLSAMQSFALRFSLLYWLLYSLPMPFSSLAPSFLSAPFTFYSNAWNRLTIFAASGIFGVEERSIAPTGSGDTTYSYVNLFVCFALAILGALAWTLVKRHAKNHAVTKDLLRSYLRYVLAATMIGYGLAKLGYIQNQFPTPGDGQLARTYGESSPMGLLWTFMGASRAYTFFGGLGEVLGGILLLWRRTTTLGAIVVVGVMTNIVMLNFSYDVPVKQYSFHLLVMAIYLLLPEVTRLANVVLWNKPTEATLLEAPYDGPGAPWGKRSIKILLVVLLGVVPIAGHAWKEVQHARKADAETSVDSPLMNRGFRWINEIPFNR